MAPQGRAAGDTIVAEPVAREPRSAPQTARKHVRRRSRSAVPTAVTPSCSNAPAEARKRVDRSGSFIHCSQPHGQRRGRSRPEDYRDVDHGSGVGEDRKHRKPDLPVDARPGPKGKPAIGRSQGWPTACASGRDRPAAGGQRHQQQERQFLDEQAGDHRQPQRIVDDEPVGRTRPAGQPRRQDGAISPTARTGRQGRMRLRRAARKAAARAGAGCGRRVLCRQSRQ